MWLSGPPTLQHTDTHRSTRLPPLHPGWHNFTASLLDTFHWGIFCDCVRVSNWFQHEVWSRPCHRRGRIIQEVLIPLSSSLQVLSFCDSFLWCFVSIVSLLMFFTSLHLSFFYVSFLFCALLLFFFCDLLKNAYRSVREDMFVCCFFFWCNLFDVRIGRRFAIFPALLVVFGVPEGLMFSFDGTGAVVRGSVDPSFFILL